MCILVVEDEVLIRLMVAEELLDAGFDVHQAESGDQAAAMIHGSKTTFTLLVTDLHMPGSTDGLGLARVMRAHYPLIPIIYTTGRPDALNGVELFTEGAALVLKPFALSDLLGVVHKLLARSGKNGRQAPTAQG